MQKLLLIGCLPLLTACQPTQPHQNASESKKAHTQNSAKQTTSQSPFDIFKLETPTNSPPLVKSARSQIGITTSYDPTYRNIAFPMGDVAKNTGVCTDVVIRAYREQGEDLQQLVNTDMKANWDAYPKTWGLPEPDPNIDHRRVPNLEVFFTKYGKKLLTTDKNSFKAGDLVTWRIEQGGKKLPHIGIVSDKKSSDGTPFIIHNIGRGTEESDILYEFTISGHFRY